MAHNRNTEISQTSARPAMDRPSIAFAWFLDSIRIADLGYTNEDGSETPWWKMVCDLCSEEICDLDPYDGDTLRVLLNTALAHTCP